MHTHAALAGPFMWLSTSHSNMEQGVHVGTQQASEHQWPHGAVMTMLTCTAGMGAASCRFDFLHKP